MSIQKKEIRLCVIIPTYNNAGTIGKVVEDVCSHCQHVIVVNDGCTDNTSAVLEGFKSRIDVVSYGKNKGKGGALVAGFRRAMEKGVAGYY